MSEQTTLDPAFVVHECFAFEMYTLRERCHRFIPISLDLLLGTVHSYIDGFFR